MILVDAQQRITGRAIKFNLVQVYPRRLGSKFPYLLVKQAKSLYFKRIIRQTKIILGRKPDFRKFPCENCPSFLRESHWQTSQLGPSYATTVNDVTLATHLATKHLSKTQPPKSARPDANRPAPNWPPWKHRLHEIIFEADTKLGKLFDIALLIAIVTSVVLVCIESTLPENTALRTAQQLQLYYWLEFFEWIFTALFTIEYILRIACVRKPLRYIFSFYGIVDLLAFLPNYVGLFTNTNSSLAVVRALRLLRIFRILKLVWLMSEAEELGQAIWSARGKVIVFLGVVVIAIVIAGTVMYQIEGQWGQQEGFDSIPKSMYWATITMTTVGYGDVVPSTIAGKTATTLLILLGYSLIIVPTGFVSAEFFVERTKSKAVTTQACPECLREGHDNDAKYCKYCAAQLNLD